MMPVTLSNFPGSPLHGVPWNVWNEVRSWGTAPFSPAVWGAARSNTATVNAIKSQEPIRTRRAGTCADRINTTLFHHTLLSSDSLLPEHQRMSLPLG